jgi:hypothetical protein
VTNLAPFQKGSKMKTNLTTFFIFQNFKRVFSKGRISFWFRKVVLPFIFFSTHSFSSPWKDIFIFRDEGPNSSRPWLLAIQTWKAKESEGHCKDENVRDELVQVPHAT